MRVPQYTVQEVPHLNRVERELCDMRALSGATWFFYNLKTKRAYTRKMNLFDYMARVHDCYYDDCLAFKLYKGYFRLTYTNNMNMQPLEFTYAFAIRDPIDVVTSTNPVDLVAMGNAVDEFFKDKGEFVNEYLKKPLVH